MSAARIGIEGLLLRRGWLDAVRARAVQTIERVLVSRRCTEALVTFAVCCRKDPGRPGEGTADRIEAIVGSLRNEVARGGAFDARTGVCWKAGRFFSVVAR
jgi:hypothetical protein